DRLPRASVALEQGYQGGVDAVVVEAPQKDGGDQAAVLAALVHLWIRGPGQEDVLADAVHLVRLALAAEHVAVDFRFPVAEARAGPGAARAPSQSMAAVAWAELLFEVVGPVDTVGVVIAEDIVGAGHHAAGAAGAEPARHHLRKQLGPLCSPPL